MRTCPLSHTSTIGRAKGDIFCEVLPTATHPLPPCTNPPSAGVEGDGGRGAVGRVFFMYQRSEKDVVVVVKWGGGGNEGNELTDCTYIRSCAHARTKQTGGGGASQREREREREGKS